MTFDTVSTAILRQFNTFYDEMCNYSKRTHIGLPLNINEGRAGFNCVCTDDGVAGVLEALEIKNHI